MNLLVVKERLLEMGKQISLKVEDEDAEQLTVSAHMSAKSYFMTLQLPMKQAQTSMPSLSETRIAEGYLSRQ